MLCEVGKVEVVPFQKPDEESRRTGLKPIAAKLAAAESVEQAERVVNRSTVLYEVVTVITFFQPCASLVIADVVALCKFLYPFLEVLVHLVFSYATNGVISLIHRYVDEVVQVGEYAHLAELGNTRKECEAYVLVLRL